MSLPTTAASNQAKSDTFAAELAPKTRHAGRVGAGAFAYLPSVEWQTALAEYDLSDVPAVATDSQDRMYLFARASSPILVFDADARFLWSWGEGLFVGPHGISIGPDDAVYCTDYLDHTVRKFTPEGELLLTLGISGCASDTGATTVDYRQIRQAGPPFSFPTNLAIAANGDLFVADGYGNARIHRFNPDGALLHSWGAPGAGPGEFHVPHGIAIDRAGLIYVADRENSRIQRFTPDGEYVDEWIDVARPCQVFIDRAGTVFVAELGYRAGMFPGNEAPTDDATGGRVSIFSPQGDLLARFGGGANPCSLGDFFAPHDICVDSRGDIYVSEVACAAGFSHLHGDGTFHSVQKLTR